MARRETFYKYVRGEKTKMTSREVKQFIMKQNNWTADEYQKKYDIFKNKLRAYESFKRAQGVNVEQQSVVSVLFKEAKAKQVYKGDYKPSRKMQQIQGFSAVSITKGRQYAQKKKYAQRVNEKYGAYLEERFEGFIQSNKGAGRIVQAFMEDAKAKGEPVNYAKLERALSDYANKVKAKVSEDEKVTDNEAIPNGETDGSPKEVDFDYNDYL